MGVARLARCHRETLFPRRKKTHLQKMIGGCQAVDPCQAHFLYQAILQCFRTVARSVLWPADCGPQSIRSPTPGVLVRNAGGLFLPAAVLPATLDQTSGKCCFYRCNALKDVRSAAPIPRTS